MRRADITASPPKALGWTRCETQSSPGAPGSKRASGAPGSSAIKTGGTDVSPTWTEAQAAPERKSKAGRWPLSRQQQQQHSLLDRSLTCSLAHFWLCASGASLASPRDSAFPSAYPSRKARGPRARLGTASQTLQEQTLQSGNL